MISSFNCFSYLLTSWGLLNVVANYKTGYLYLLFRSYFNELKKYSLIYII